MHPDNSKPDLIFSAWDWPAFEITWLIYFWDIATDLLLGYCNCLLLGSRDCPILCDLWSTYFFRFHDWPTFGILSPTYFWDLKSGLPLWHCDWPTFWISGLTYFEDIVYNDLLLGSLFWDLLFDLILGSHGWPTFWIISTDLRVRFLNWSTLGSI